MSPEAKDALLESQAQQLQVQAQQIEELKSLNAKLVEQIESLQAQLRQNSTNSNQPPSSDGPGAQLRGVRPKRSSRRSSGRKRGGQKGHKGAHRSLFPPEQVDEFIELFPEACLRCATLLPRIPDLDARRYQQVELYETGMHVQQWRRHEVACPHCNHANRARYDTTVIPQSAFGPVLVAKIALLTGDYHLSRRKAQRFLREFFGLSISLGALRQCEPRVSEALKPASDEIEQEVVTSPVQHADATTWLLAGAIRSLWSYSTKTAVLYRIFANGQTPTIRPLFGTLTGILVSDRAPVFAFWSLKRRQICWSHLLRKFVAFTQRDGPASTWGETLLGYAKLIFEYWQAFCEGVLSRAEFQIWMKPVIQHTEHALGRVAQADLGSISGSCADILAHRQALWTFVTHEGVEPTNNVAERDLRAWVIWRKICFGCQSERGLRFAERIMTVTNTLRKRGLHVLDFLIRSVVAHTTQQPMPSLGS